MEKLSTIPTGSTSATTVSNVSIQTDEKSTISLDTKELVSKTLLDDQNFAYKPYDAVLEYGSMKQNSESYETVKLKPKKYLENQTLESVVVAEDHEVIIPLTRPEYVANFKASEARSAYEILLMSRTTYEAEKSLNSAEFSAFCNDIGYRDSSSVIRKFVVIGKIQPRLIAHAEILPASWSSLYLLTQIPAQIFENMVEMKRSFKELSVSEISKLVKHARDLNNLNDVINPALLTSEEKNGRILNSTIVAKIYFTKQPDDLDWHTFEKALLEVQANLPIRVQFFSVLSHLFSKRKDARYEKIKLKDAPNPFIPEKWDLGKQVAKMSQTNLNPST